MRLYKMLLVCIASVFLIAFTSINHQNSKSKTLSYQNKKNVFTIVVIRDHTMYKNAKNRAIQKAAEIAKAHKYKSFNVLSEEEAQVIPGKNNWPSAWDFPQNLYQEEVIQKGYNRDRRIQGSRRDYRIHSAIKIKIKCYVSAKKGSEKVCKIIKC